MEGRFNERVFCVTGLGGLYLERLIHGGAYFRNFTIFLSDTGTGFLDSCAVFPLCDHQAVVDLNKGPIFRNLYQSLNPGLSRILTKHLSSRAM